MLDKIRKLFSKKNNTSEKQYKKRIGIYSREIEVLLAELEKEPKNALSVRDIRNFIDILHTIIDELEDGLYFEEV